MYAITLAATDARNMLAWHPDARPAELSPHHVVRHVGEVVAALFEPRR